MARGRMIDKVIILSKKINAVSEGAENLYYRLYVNTDDFGLFHADPKIIKGQIYTLRKISIPAIEKRLNELIDIELIKIYENNDEKYLEIVDFEKHQTFRKDYVRKHKYPKPNTNSYELVRTRTKSPTKLSKIKLNKIKLIKEFENFWKPYPKKVGKKIAYLNWEKLNKEQRGECILASKNYGILVKREGREAQFIKDPSGFLNKEKEFWKDYIKEIKSHQIGENIHKPTERGLAYQKARAIKWNEIHKKYKPDIEKAKKEMNLDRLEELNNQIKIEIAEFSKEYSAKEKT